MKKIFAGLMLLALSPLAQSAELAPGFKLPTTQGDVNISALKGKVVYVDFWASWCKPCKQSFPWLNDLQAKYKAQGLEVVAINLDKDRASADDFLQAVPAQFTVAFDPAGSIAEQYRLQGMPSTYLIDRQGNLRAQHIGFRDHDKQKLEQAINKLLAEK